MFLASLNFLWDERTRELTVSIILPMHVCVIIQQLHLQRINPYSIRHFCNTRNFFYTTSQKILTCTPVITGTQCSVCAFLSAFVFISSCICVWYRAWSHLLLKSCCYQSIRSICVFVFVYLCICVFVFMYLCICVLGAACCWNPAVARRRDALRNTLLPAQLAACRACLPQIQV